MEQLISPGPDGRFWRSDAPTLLVGVDHAVPRAASADAMRADLAAIVALGLNAVRVRTMAERAMLERAAGDQELAIVCDEDAASAAVARVEFTARPDAHVLGFDGLGDSFFHTFLPFVVRRAVRPGRAVLVSLRVGAALEASREDAWLRAALPAAVEAGAAGIFWAGLRGPDGLLGHDGTARAGRAFLGEFVRSEGAAPTGSEQTRVGLWMPHEAEDADVTRRLLLAQYFLRVTGHSWRAVRGGDAQLGSLPSLLVPGVPVAADDVAMLRAWVERGGRLFWHGPDPLQWDGEVAALLGAKLVDLRSGRGISVNAFGERFTLAHFPHDLRAELAPVGAGVLAADHQGLPALLEHRVGTGRVRWALPIVEDAIVPVAAHPGPRDRWAAWYRGMLAG